MIHRKELCLNALKIVFKKPTFPFPMMLSRKNNNDLNHCNPYLYIININNHIVCTSKIIKYQSFFALSNNKSMIS